MTAPCMLPNSADAPTDWTCTSWMKSTPGSDRASPLHGQVKFVPSMRNAFSLVPEPNAETLLVELFHQGRLQGEKWATRQAPRE